MFDMVATDRVAVSGYHMPFPSLGYVERRKDGGYRWIAIPTNSRFNGTIVT